MFKSLKYGDFIKINFSLQLIKNVEILEDNYYKLTLKDMKSGRIRSEILNKGILNKVNIKKVKIKYLNSDEHYHYFKDVDINEEIKFKLRFIGSDFEYIIGKKEKPFHKKVLPILCNIFPNNIKKDTFIELSCLTKNAKIYYTLDGSEPNQNSILYNKPILIDDNKFIRARAYKDKYESSFISDFDFKIRNRKIKLFLSPSNQDYNVGIFGSNYTTEMVEMNKLCDILENILKKYNILIYRNNPDSFIEDWSSINRLEYIDCHLALHSNATSGSWKKGVEIWIHDEYSETYSLAKLIYDNVYSLYYDKNIFTNRGVKYAKGTLAEANPEFFKFSMILEVAYHDNMEDAKWILENREKIAIKIAEVLIYYF